MAMTSKELYPSLVQLIINAENITWNRFYNFLMFNTILVLSWTTLWTASNAPQSRPVVLVSICIFGGLSGIFWAALGYRGRAFLAGFMDMAKEFEADLAVWSNDLEKYRHVTKAIELRDSLCYSWAGSRVLLIGPLAFTVLYGVLLVISTFEGRQLGQHYFISCWTDSRLENLPLWQMYTGFTGVRIGLPSDMFKTYNLNPAC